MQEIQGAVQHQLDEGAGMKRLEIRNISILVMFFLIPTFCTFSNGG